MDIGCYIYFKKYLFDKFSVRLNLAENLSFKVKSGPVWTWIYFKSFEKLSVRLNFADSLVRFGHRDYWCFIFTHVDYYFVFIVCNCH